jgi:hypothetical protein
VRVEVLGGAVGVVLDCRDVPVQLPRRLDDRRAVLAGWREELLAEPGTPHPASDAARHGASRRLGWLRPGRGQAPGHEPASAAEAADEDEEDAGT